VSDDAERRRLLDFLESGAVILDVGARSTDLLEPRRAGAVPLVFRTDGTWIWSDAVAYYLRWHRVAPEPDLAAHIRACDYRPAQPPGDTRQSALAALRAAEARYQRDVRRWQVETGQLVDPSRFPFDIQDRLLAMGWRPGRDVSDEIEPWLDENMARLRHYEFAANGYRPYEPFDAARRVFREFGGLRSGDNGPGMTSARVPFLIFPGTHREERSLTLSAFNVADYGREIGQPVFQLGTIENGAALLVIAGDGSVHLTGDVERFVGRTFDEAVVALLNGDLPADDPDTFDPFA
jgi:hypothetical protein